MIISRGYTRVLMAIQLGFLFLIIIVAFRQSSDKKCPNQPGQNKNSHTEDLPETSSQTNLILGAANSLSIEVISPFVQSARLTCSSCVISLFIHKRESEYQDFVDLATIYNIEWLIYEDYNIGINHAEPWNLIRRIRWLLFSTYFSYLEKQNIKIDHVFITDVADITFQTNIFTHMTSHETGIYFFTESPPVSVSDLSEHREAFISCFDMNVADQLANKTSISSSTILGSWEAMLFYVTSMSNLILNKEEKPCEGFHFDHHFHYYVIYLTSLSNKTNIHQISEDTGFVATKIDRNNMHRNGFGLLLNNNESIYSVVHDQHANNKK